MKIKSYIILTFSLIFILVFPLSYSLAHSGRTDSNGGHRDNKNVSGLGYYHYHHGYPAHLHTNGVCPYSSTSHVNQTTTTKSNDNYYKKVEQEKNDAKNSGKNDGYDDGYKNSKKSYQKYNGAYSSLYKEEYDKNYKIGIEKYIEKRKEEVEKQAISDANDGKSQSSFQKNENEKVVNIYNLKYNSILDKKKEEFYNLGYSNTISNLLFNPENINSPIFKAEYLNGVDHAKKYINDLKQIFYKKGYNNVPMDDFTEETLPLKNILEESYNNGIMQSKEDTKTTIIFILVALTLYIISSSVIIFIIYRIRKHKMMSNI